jgi:hypothetical protein
MQDEKFDGQIQFELPCCDVLCRLHAWKAFHKLATFFGEHWEAGCCLPAHFHADQPGMQFGMNYGPLSTPKPAIAPQ